MSRLQLPVAPAEASGIDSTESSPLKKGQVTPAAMSDGDMSTTASSAGERAGSDTYCEYVKGIKEDSQVHPPNLSLDSLRRALPKEVFVKSVFKSTMWMLWDMAVISACFIVAKDFVYMNDSMPLIAKCVVIPLIWMVAGFFMWALFVVGHDCGHGSFSDDATYNFTCGLISHGYILVPFSAWARSHRFHHMFHNHVRKDYSFPWAHDPELDNPAQAYLNKHPVFRAWFFPVLGYFFYLNCPQYLGGVAPWLPEKKRKIAIGVDGNHYFPFRTEKLWKDADDVEIRSAWISTAAVAAYIVFFITVFFNPTLASVFFDPATSSLAFNPANLVFSFDTFLSGLAMYYAIYVPSWFVLCYWLYTVTYLQHHGPTTKVYDDSTWRYVTAAFETIDRKYGGPIDFLHHRISDCHVIHHLFFTKIPHYNLKKATDAMLSHLEKEDIKFLYQYDVAPDFYTRVFRYMYRFGTRAHLFTKNVSFYSELRARKQESKKLAKAKALAKKEASGKTD